MSTFDQPIIFTNRFESGLRLAQRLKELRSDLDMWQSSPTVVVALPRGGVQVASVVAQMLNAPLDILASKKIGAPENSEVALGAVTSGGVVIVEQRWAAFLDVSDNYIESETKRLLRKTQENEEELLMAAGVFERPDINGAVVLIIDDGIATGMTALAAIRDVRHREPRLIILATPVIAQDTYYALRTECDHLVALHSTRAFAAVGQFYNDFHQVSDAEVVELLRRSATQMRRAGESAQIDRFKSA